VSKVLSRYGGDHQTVAIARLQALAATKPKVERLRHEALPSADPVCNLASG
jgi:hypothetical protein